jgi:hypothetical protein
MPDGLKQWRFLFGPQARGVEILLGGVMRRNPRAACRLSRADGRATFSALVVIFDAHRGDGSHAYETVDHHADERPIH